MPKICTMEGVQEHSEHMPVELWRDDDSHRLTIRAYNECGDNCVNIDLWQLVDWLKVGPCTRTLSLSDAHPTKALA